MPSQNQIFCDSNHTGIIPCVGYSRKQRKVSMRSELHFTGETNHRWKYTTWFSGTEDDEAYEGETAERAGRTVLPAERSEGEAMHKETGKDGLPPCNDENSQGKSYGCLFCKTGKEQNVAEQIQTTCPNVRATVMRQLKYRTCKKVKTQEEAILLPSYVFFETPSSMEPSIEFPMQNVIRILAMDSGIWQLQGEDERFVKWLFQYDGLLGFSKAYKKERQSNSNHLRSTEGYGGKNQTRRQTRHERSGHSLFLWQGHSGVAGP